MKTQLKILAAAALGLAVFSLGNAADDKQGAEKTSHFSRQTVDFGIVVSDIDKSLKFYQDALGLTELSTFDVPKDLGGSTGLSDDRPFHIHVLALGEEESATKVKLMQFKDTPGKKIDNKFIHSSYGVRYLTIFVNDLNKALERAKKAGVIPIAQGPVKVPENIAPGMGLAVVRDPDGNMVELVGPMKNGSGN